MSNIYAHTDPLFKKSNILKLEGTRLFELGQFMYCCKNYLLPERFNSMFLLNNQVPTYNTIYLGAFRVPLCRTNIKQFPVSLPGPKFH